MFVKNLKFKPTRDEADERSQAFHEVCWKSVASLDESTHSLYRIFIITQFLSSFRV